MAKPQVDDPSHSPWFVPLPALDGCGASVAVQEVPFCCSINPHALPAVSLYQPTRTQPLAAGQVVDAV